MATKPPRKKICSYLILFFINGPEKVNYLAISYNEVSYKQSIEKIYARPPPFLSLSCDKPLSPQSGQEDAIDMEYTRRLPISF